MIRGLQERVALALAVDIDEHLADPPERGDRDRHVVDEGRAPPGPRQPPREDQVVFIDRRLQDLGGEFSLFGAGQFEPAGDAEFVGPGADQFGIAPLAEKQAERPEQQRLAGPGLAGPGAEPRLQFDPHVLDQRQVLHGQFAEHAAMVRERQRGEGA